MTPYCSMSYREIASRYNALNALPPHAALQVGSAIARYARGKMLLDLGAGAGRLGIPAALAGCRVVALDLELAMLRAGPREAGLQAVELPSIQANAVHVPFCDESFDAVMINNLLHLVPQWEAVLVEAVRVMRPDGVLIQGRDWLDPQSCAGRIRAKWREVVTTLRSEMRPTTAAGPALFQTLARMGGQIEAEILAAEWTECLTPARILHRMRQRMHNETWSLDDDLLRSGLAMLEPWVRETFDDLQAEEDVTWRFVLTVTYALKRVR
ncbi:class I SAM-dependent methyltransferase [Candidatus Roseilinea sp. NK_OTU-006]|nr:class I SAM-dependent methyltransferase [Candidatus Roseilinea sp. NK_OTU-006]